MIVSVVNSTLQMLQAMSKEDVTELIERMYEDSALYAEIVHCDILTENLNLAQKKEFIAGTLPREVYMPKFHQDLYKNYDLLFLNKITYMSNVLFRGAAKSSIKNIMACRIISYASDYVMLYVGVLLKNSLPKML